MLPIEEPLNNSQPNSKYAFLHLAFRPFFLGAAFFAVISMLIWTWLYSFGGQLNATPTTSIVWHAHEMIFGYSSAVIAGFVLTAIQNWTGVPTIKGKPLLILFLIWVSARVLPMLPFIAFEITVIFDSLFYLLLIIAAIKPILQVKQYKQSVIIIVLFLLFISNSIFYFGVYQVIENGIHVSLYSGLYLIIFLIFVMARRVMPFFIEKGVDTKVSLKNYLWLDISTIILFVLYAFFEIFNIHQLSLMIFSGLLLVLHSFRMIGWYTNGIWKKPLLWSIYLAYGFIVFGFALKLLISYYNFLPLLEIHSFAVGGISLMTLAMMSRVALGHTSRNVFEPPKVVFWMVLVLTIAIICRVILPMLIPTFYSLWILLSQILWIITFILFLIIYFPVLIRSRIDGRPG